METLQGAVEDRTGNESKDGLNTIVAGTGEGAEEGGGEGDGIGKGARSDNGGGAGYGVMIGEGAGSDAGGIEFGEREQKLSRKTESRLDAGSCFGNVTT